MEGNLYYNTVTPWLLNVLKQLMGAKEFEKFRLVGGTALSLQKGHRFSMDIDLFTDADQGSVDLKEIDRYLRYNFQYIDVTASSETGPGKSYFIGTSKETSVKLDVFYTDKYIRPVVETGNIRMAGVEEILAIKIDMIARGGRKKDFWDIHELMPEYPLNIMMDLHQEKYPYSHDEKLIKKQLVNFAIADDDADPECLKGKIWEVIKLDMIDFVKAAY